MTNCASLKVSLAEAKSPYLRRKFLKQLASEKFDADTLCDISKSLESKLASRATNELIEGCEMVSTLFSNAKMTDELQRYASSTASRLLKWVKALDDECWTETACDALCAALTTVVRIFGHVKMCDQKTTVTKCVSVLSDRKARLFHHATALKLLLRLQFPALFCLDLSSSLKRHYVWNKVVFDSATLLEPGQPTASMARVHYIGAWKALVKFYLFKLLPLGSPPAVDLLEVATDVLGPAWIPLLEIERIVTTCQSSSASPPPKVCHSAVRDAHATLRRLHAEANAAADCGADDDSEEMPKLALEVDAFDVTPSKLGKRPSTSSGPSVTPTKRRKRRAQDVFDVPKRFRLNQSKDIIFIFHATDGRAVMKSPVPTPACGTSPAWFKWMQKKGCTIGKGVAPSSRLPWNGVLDAATFQL
uniref:Uncharacterized protein n=1 Tax=Plectus sambesii TaxID=2011161 RepID=A0A914WP25_9BILA